MSDPAARRARELTAMALWAGAALAWVAAMRVPWSRHGLASSTTPMDAAELTRTGVLDIPPAASLAVVVLPLLAVALLAIAPLRGRGATIARVALWLVSCIGGLALAVLLASVSAASLGWGAALVVVACVLGGTALLTQR
ncbi:hypothetical protein [Nocardioides sp. GXZ039]|uniref:hypothetical protein n=1 Tax=Nocardioides sp. GXZ039 TaxID=3136018 RepID=UPI0030F43E1C